MRTLLVALGASLAMAGSAFAMDGMCMGSKAYTADAGKHSKQEASKTAEASKPETTAPAAAPSSKTADVTKSSATSKAPS